MGEIKYTPMMEQYLEIKKDYKDAIVFFRLGDFYEMFFDDAYIASRELELALTGKDAGAPERVPMCGVPFHSCDGYIEKLIAKNYKVVIVEQTEDPKEAVGLVKRGVTKIITPGTIDLGLNDKENNFIASIAYIKRTYVLCYSDTSTGEGYVTEFKNFELLLSELLALHIREIIINNDFNNKMLSEFVINNQITLSIENRSDIPASLGYIVSELDPAFHSVVGLLLQYFIDTQKKEPSYFKKFKSYEPQSFLRLDAFTKKNLELCETLRFSNKNGSLLYHLDHCSTAMGSRLLHKWIDKPLKNLNLINERLDFVDSFNNNYLIREDIRGYFKDVYDLERIIGRISAGNANAKDLVWLRRSLKNIPAVIEALKCLGTNASKEFACKLNPHDELYALLSRALIENPPLSIKEGGMVNPGFDQRLDEIRNIATNSKDWIANYEAQLKETIGLKNLKVGYNRVTGYYIEITKAQLRDVPEEMLQTLERRATLVSSERFISPELKQYENIVINAKEQIESLEYEIFCLLRAECAKHITTLQELADNISTLDCYISLSDVALKYNYVRPTFNNNRCVNIVDGRHPVLESIMQSDYIVNDVVINQYNMVLITGPNMSGKSTYMRMLACIIIMAQIGSFVPAKSADLMLFDQIFTRIGASDDLVSGQSTFMVEMVEANYAIANATKNSLVLFDEIGRGTATFDGMALAQAILEYLHEKVNCITLFSTHYHELTSLEGKLKRLKNVHVEAKEQNGKIAFLHKVIDGPTDKSYGINVASLAGLPKSLLERSKQVLEALEEESQAHKGVKLDLFNFDAFEAREDVALETIAEKIKDRLDEIDVNKLTPIEALNILYELKELK